MWKLLKLQQVLGHRNPKIGHQSEWLNSVWRKSLDVSLAEIERELMIH